jgi:hypothetical protein
VVAALHTRAVSMLSIWRHAGVEYDISQAVVANYSSDGQPFSTGFPAFFQPTMPCGMMYTFVCPSFFAATAAVWHACQPSL